MIYGIDYLIMGVIGRMLGIIGSFLLPGYVYLLRGALEKGRKD